MNIRSVSNPVSTEGVQSTDTKTDASSRDRDPNSGEQGGGQQKRRKYSDEELKDIAASLSENPGVIQNNLTVTTKNEGDVSIILIQDHLGNTVRRLSGTDLHDLAKDKMDRPGHLLHKAV